MATRAVYGRKGDAAPVRLMLVDDSIVARSVFQSIIGPHGDFAIVATVSGAEQALAVLSQTSVDIVVLDLEMPGIDGLTALPEILARGAGARVLVVSASAGPGADACVRALTLGAADTLEKPRAGAFDEAFRRNFVDKLRRVAAEVPPRAAEPAAAIVPAAPAITLQPSVDGPVGCVAIGASTGGLHALSAFFKALPASCDAPILITQHLPASFMPYFAAQMTEIAHRPATVARTGDRLERGHILVAPGDAHLRLVAVRGGTAVSLDRAAAPSGCLPSVDPMFDAVAERFGPQAFAVVLSGMGRDGSIAARGIVERGGEIVVQDRASSVVWGMPGSIAAAGLAATVDAPGRLAARLAERCAQQGQRRGAAR